MTLSKAPTMILPMLWVVPSISSVSFSQKPHLLRIFRMASEMPKLSSWNLASMSSPASMKAAFRSVTDIFPSVAIWSSSDFATPRCFARMLAPSGAFSRSWFSVSLSTMPFWKDLFIASMMAVISLALRPAGFKSFVTFEENSTASSSGNSSSLDFARLETMPAMSL